MSSSATVKKHVYPLKMENENKRLNTAIITRTSTPKTNTNPRPITAKKRATQIFKAKNEIERWAYGTDNVEEIGYESDEVKSIDDGYLDDMADKDYDDIVIDNKVLNKKRETISHILKEVRNHKKKVFEMTRKDPNFIASDLKSYAINEIIVNKKTEKDETKERLSTIGPNPFGAAIFDFNPKDSEELESKKSDSRPTSAKKEGIGASMKFKASKNGLSRAVPGKLQQNITLERNFFRDLLKLSRQRYLVKINTDYQKRKFTDIQAKKGLCEIPGTERSKHSELSRTKSAYSSKSSVNQYSRAAYTNEDTDEDNNYDFKKRSVSAFVKRKASTPVSRLASRNENKPSVSQLDMKEFIEPTTDNEENLEDELNKMTFKSAGSQSCLSHVSFKSEPSTLKNASTKKSSSSQMSNDTLEAGEDYHVHEQKIRCASAYEKRSNQSLARASQERELFDVDNQDYRLEEQEMRCASTHEKRGNKSMGRTSKDKQNQSENTSTHDVISIVNEANDPKLSDPISEFRNNKISASIRRTQSLKRPNTSIAVQRINFAQEALKNSPKKESAKPLNNRVETNHNPVVDSRYISLLGTMGTVYVPKTLTTPIQTRQTVDERVRNLLNNNEALQSWDGTERERKNRLEIEKNMKLFEKICHNYL